MHLIYTKLLKLTFNSRKSGHSLHIFSYIITPIQGGVPNASPVVWTKKLNSSLQMCMDIKTRVNRKIKSETYPTPKIEILFSKLTNVKKFAILDLTSAYWQIELEEKAKILSVINTSKGLYKVNVADGYEKPRMQYFSGQWSIYYLI